MSNIFNITGLSVAFETELLHNINFSITQASVSVIMGANGTGKSTFLHILSNLMGFKAHNNINASYTNMYKANITIAHLLQNSSEMFFYNRSLIKQLIYDSKANINYFNYLIKELNLGYLLNKLNNKIYTFSGGELQRLAIISLLLQKPQLVLLDEPTSNLDVFNQASLVKLIIKLQNNFNTTFIITSHNSNFISVLQYQTNLQLYLIKNKSIFYVNSFATPVFNYIQHTKKYNTKVILNINNLSIKLKSGKLLLHNANLQLHEQNSIVITGLSGLGKTTIAKVIMGESQSVIVGGFINKFTSNIQLIPQNYSATLPPHYSIINLLLADIKIQNYKLFKKQKLRLILNYCNKLKLNKKVLYKNKANLSGGEQLKIVIIRSLIMRPNLIILDESTSALDIESENALIDILLQIQSDFNISYIFITHKNLIEQKLNAQVFVLQNNELNYINENVNNDSNSIANSIL